MNDDPEQAETPDDSPVIRDLRDKAKRTDDAEAKVTNLERENVLLRSGLTLNDKQIKALTAAHDGDWTPEGITATATELGFSKPPDEPAEPKIPTAETDAMRRAVEATGAAPPPPPDLASQIMQATSPDQIKALLLANNMLAGQDQ